MEDAKLSVVAAHGRISPPIVPCFSQEKSDQPAIEVHESSQSSTTPRLHDSKTPRLQDSRTPRLSSVFQHRPRIRESRDSTAAHIQRGAEAVVVAYHSCYRALCRKEGVHGLPLFHYTDLISEALDLKPFSHAYKELALGGDVETAVAKLSVRGDERGIDERRLRSAAASIIDEGGSAS